QKARCALRTNEGVGSLFEYAGRRCYPVCCAEKGVFRFTVTTDGVAGHASMPGMGDNALLKMAPSPARRAERQPAYRVSSEAREILVALGEDADAPAGAVADLRAADPRLGVMFEAVLRGT